MTRTEGPSTTTGRTVLTRRRLVLVIMPSESVTYTLIMIALIAGVAAMLAAEYFHGLEVLLPAGGVVALVAVGGLTLAISRS